MPDQDNIWAGTEFGGGDSSQAPKSDTSTEPKDAPSNDVWGGTEFGKSGVPRSNDQNLVASRPADQRFASRSEAPDMAISDVAKQAITNLPRSAGEFGHALAQPFLHPSETAEAMGKIGTGIYSKAKGALGVEQPAAQKAQDESAINAVVDFYKDRYGNLNNVKRAIAEDPVGVLADASSVLGVGGFALGRIPGAIGTMGEAVSTAGKLTDPVNIAMQAPKAVGKIATTAINAPASIQSGSAFKSLQEAYNAGIAKDPAFWDHYTGRASGTELVDKVQNSVDQMAKERSQNYIAGLKGEDAQKAAATLPYDLVDQSLADAKTRAFNLDNNGNIINAKSPALEAAYNALEKNVNQFRSANIGHTISDFNNMKITLRNQGKAAAGYDAEANKLVNDVANSAKQTIIDPKYGKSENYAKVMDEYGNASDELSNVRAALLSGRTPDTKLNKILKTYKAEGRQDLMDAVYKRDPSLASSIAGYDLAGWMPTGFRGNVVSSILYGGAGLANPALWTHPIHLAASSPKLMGGLNYTAGRLGAVPGNIYSIAPYAAEASRAGQAEELVNRPQRASGGRISPDSNADALVRAAEAAKKDISKGTEALLDQPDETITRALAVAKKHI